MRPVDLTRWNRAGLERFRYVDGNAVTYLERLREALVEAFDPDETGKWLALTKRFAPKPGETQGEGEARLLAQYADSRRDYGWEILRAFARSTHVLTEHVDAYANETFIGTATQWDSLRRLLALLDAHPAPPASARTELAFEAKARAVLGAGFAVKNLPKGEDPPAIFETQDDLALDPALNALCPTAWDRSQARLAFVHSDNAACPQFPLDPHAEPPTVGEFGVLVVSPEDGTSDGEKGYGVQVSNIRANEALLLSDDLADADDLELERVSLLAGAKRVQTPRLAGDDVVILTPNHNLVAGRATVAWLSGTGSSRRTNRVLAVDGDRVRLSGPPFPPKGRDLYLLARAGQQRLGGSDRVVLPNTRDAEDVWSPEMTNMADALLTCKKIDADGNKYILYDYAMGYEHLFFLPAGSVPVARVDAAAPNQLVLAGKVEELKQGAWIVSAGDEVRAMRVDAVTPQDGDTVLVTEPAMTDFAAPIYAGFANTHLPLDHGRNMSPAYDSDAGASHVTRLFVSPDPWPKLLARGRRVIVETEGLVHAATVRAVDADAGTIDVAPPVPGTELTDRPVSPGLMRWNTRIRANVVAADHGETRLEKILGSGDATRSNQVFELAAQGLSFVADRTMPAGVRAAVEVRVGERTWTQVASLRESSPTDAHYEVRMTENGRTLVCFGDGRNGRRLPTGTDNVRVAWRKGVGEAGNLAVGSLRKIVRPDPSVAAVRQPLSASGGAAAEGVAALRKTGAARLLTLGRAVSVADFANLAAQNASVLQAHAWRATAGGARGEKVTVVVVPAGGRMGTLDEELTGFLTEHALPGVTVRVDGYTAVPLSLDVTVQVRTAAYDPERVAGAVRAVLVSAWSLKAARLGAPVYRSQVMAVIEKVEGVENAAAAILTAQFNDIEPAPGIGRRGTGDVRVIRPAPNQMVQIVDGVSEISIRWMEFEM